MPHFRHPTRALLAASAAALALPSSALATFPGHNGRIAFHSATATEGTQIFTARPNGSDLRQITHVAGDAISADWSPDGRRIAFEIDTPDSAEVALMNADGSDLVTLPGVGLFNGDPSFTPDGRRLVYGFFDGENSGVASMRLDGGDQRAIQLGEVEDPNVSPDGTRISLTCQQVPDVLQALCTIPARGGPVTNLTPFTAEVGAKSDWSPDGTQLVFTDHADRPSPGDSANVATVGADGTGERLLTHFSGGQVNAFAGSYSPDGREIVFRLEDHGRFGLCTIRPDGTHLRAILPLSDRAPRFIDWGPRARGDEDDDRSSASTSTTSPALRTDTRRAVRHLPARRPSSTPGAAETTVLVRGAPAPPTGAGRAPQTTPAIRAHHIPSRARRWQLADATGRGAPQHRPPHRHRRPGRTPMPHRRITTITTALVLTALALASAGPAGATTYRLSGRQFGDMA